MVFASPARRSGLSAQESASLRNLCVLSASASDFSHSLPFIVPLRPRWSPVAFPWEMPCISFSSIPLHDFSLQNHGGYTPPPRSSFPSVLSLCLGDSVAILSRLFATHPKIAPVTPFLATLPKTQDLKSCICHTSKKWRGWGSYC